MKSAKLTAVQASTPDRVVPDGWQLVPKVPTLAMLASLGGRCVEHWAEGDQAILSKRYKQTLAASPKFTGAQS